MTILSLLTAAPAIGGAPDHLDPVKLFLDADIVVQLVMAGLLIASVWVWTIIVSFSFRLAAAKRRCARFEEEFWRADDFDAFMKQTGKRDIPSARIAAAAMSEWRSSAKLKAMDRDGTRQRLAGAMESQVAQEADSLAERLNFLATVGSVAPFVGLFGTVWGIMNSFLGLSMVQQATLSTVAPGIAEALIATAIGLFAAIPAVMAYNRFSARGQTLSARYYSFANELQARLHRRLHAGSPSIAAAA